MELSWRWLDAAANGRAARARSGQRRPWTVSTTLPHPSFSLLPSLPIAIGGRRWVGEHACGDPDGCCDVVPRRILAAEAAGRRGGDAVQRLSTFLGFPPPCASVISDVLRHVRSATASKVLAHGSGRNPRAATACAVNGDARGCRHLLGGVGMTPDQTSSSSTERNLGLASRPCSGGVSTPLPS
uniref:Uncharacterized protein n=1 Tax=Aegilops tauschii TaxID=37682 RepID=M8BG84_AEGTA